LDHFFHLLFSLKETANSLISHYYVDANFSVKCVCRYAKFQGVASLTLHFPRNFGANATCIHYIGLRGEATQVRLTCWNLKSSGVLCQGLDLGNCPTIILIWM
jgi:hypothetical protein